MALASVRNGHRISAAGTVGWMALTAMMLQAGTACAAPVRYTVNASKSKLLLHAQEAGLVSATRTLAAGDFSGTVDFDRNTMLPTAMSMRVKTASIKSVDNLSASDRAMIDRHVQDDALEAGKFPIISYQSSRVVAKKTAAGQYDVRVIGILTLHGVSQTLVLHPTATIFGGTLRAKGSFSITQTPFKITLLSLMGGAISVADPVSFDYDMVVQK